MKDVFLDFSQVETGDILLFSGYSELSVGVHLATTSRWNHAGIAVWLNKDLCSKLNITTNLVGENNKILCILESNNDLSFDMYTQSIMNAAGLMSMEPQIKKSSLIACRKISVTRDDNFYDKTVEFIKKCSRKKYRESYVDVSLGWLGILGVTNDTICSELCARYLEHIGLVSKAWVINNDPKSMMPAIFGIEMDMFPDGTFLYNKPIVIMQRKSKFDWRFLAVVIIVIVIIILIIIFRKRTLR